MKTGIMGAMPEEVDIIRKQMKGISEISFGSRTYYKGKINDYDVILVFSRWGKVAASTTATTLITKFEIERLIFTGVAGATNIDLNIGDVVIPEKLYQHDMNASPLFPKHEIPLTGVTFFSADATLVKEAKRATETFLSQAKEIIPSETLQRFGISAPKCNGGFGATGDQFIADAKQTTALVDERPQTSVVEMEGAAVAQVCHDFGIPFVVIRTVSDRADHGAHIDFPAFVNEVAKHYSENIIEKMLRPN